MSFRTDIYSLLEFYRPLLGPTGFDLCMNQLTIRVSTWSGTYVNEGTETVTSTLVLPQQLPMKLLTQDDVDGSGGAYKVGDVLVDGITPVYTTAQLDPARTAENIDVQYVVTGPLAGIYSLRRGYFDKPFTWRLQLEKRL